MLRLCEVLRPIGDTNKQHAHDVAVAWLALPDYSDTPCCPLYFKQAVALLVGAARVPQTPSSGIVSWLPSSSTGLTLLLLACLTFLSFWRILSLCALQAGGGAAAADAVLWSAAGRRRVQCSHGGCPCSAHIQISYLKYFLVLLVVVLKCCGAGLQRM